MSTTFIIEAEKKCSAVGRIMTLPAHDFGDTAIRMVDFWNWYKPDEKPYMFELLEPVKGFDALAKSFKMFAKDKSFAVPIGSVEFVLAWFKAMGVDNVKPLNIPKELWHFCDRKLAIGYPCDFNGRYMMKSVNEIKSAYNRQIELYNEEPDANTGCMEFFFSEWLDDVESEWRVFVFNGEVRDIRCYSGDFWRVPDRDYIERVVKEYNNPSYTLDVMVTSKRTEILELHDFFSCGLYGFDDTILPMMWKSAIRNVLRRYEK